MVMLFVLTDFSMFKKEFHFKNSFKRACARKRLRSLKFHTLTIANSFVATASNQVRIGLTYLNKDPEEGWGRRIPVVKSTLLNWFLCKDVPL